MPIGGERIGSAYIRIFGDGSALPDDIRDALQDAEPAIRAAGRRQGDAYAEEFQGGLTRDQTRDFGKTLRENLERGIAESDLTNAYFESEDWKRFQGRLREEFGESGEVAGRALQDRFIAAGSGRGLSDAVRNLIPDIRRATREIQIAEEQYLQDRDAAYAEYDLRESERLDDDFARRVRRLAEINEAHAQAIEERDQQRDEEFSREVRRLADYAELFDQAERQEAEDRDRRYQVTIRNLERTSNDVIERARLVNEALQRLGTTNQRDSDSRAALIRDLGFIRDNLGAVPAGEDRNRLTSEVDTLRRRLRQATPEADRFNNALTRMADGFGRATGRGSRNNFVNFIGSAVRGLTNLATVIPRVGFSVIQKAFNAFQDGGKGIAGIGQALISLGTSAAFGVVGIGAVAAAFTGLLFILGPVAALISGITAALLGLGSTVILGAIAGLVGALGVGSVFVAGIGAATLAITGMSDEMKNRLKPELDATKDAFKELGEAAGDGIGPGLERSLGRLPSIMERVRPAIVDISEAVGDVADSLSKDLDTRGFERFAELAGGFVANQVRDLGEAVSDFGRGFGGFFLAARPLIRDTVNGIQDLAERFGDFTNSREGQREIRSFLKDAASSASSLVDFIGAASKAIGTLALAGNDSGNTLVDDMTSKLREFTEYLNNNPDAVRDFFANGIDVARDIGNAIKFIGDFIGDLDTEESRQQLQDFFSTIGDLGGAVRDAAPFFIDLANVIETVADAIGASIQTYEVLGEILQGFLTLDFSGLTGDLDDLQGTLNDLFQIKTGTTNTGLDIFRERAAAAADATQDLADANADLRNSLDSMTGAATEATEAIILKKAEESGAADAARRLGVTTRDVIAASLGNAAAQKRVAEATGKATERERAAVDALLGFTGATNKSVEAQQRQQRATARALQSFDSLRGSLSKPIIAKLEEKGIQPTLRGLAKTVDKYDELDTRKNIEKLIELTGVDATVADVRAAMAKLDELDRKKPKPKLDVDPARLNAGVNDARGKLDTLGRQVATPSINVDSGGAAAAIAGIGGALSNLPASKTIRIIAEQIGDFNPFGADGGTVGKGTLDPNLFKGLMSGGTISGPRYPYGDRDLYRLAPGEEVISNRMGQADRYRGLLKAINAGQNIGAALAAAGGPGKSVDASGWQIVTPTADPRAVADEVFARLNAATSF